MTDALKSKPWLPYVAPMAIYMAFLLVQSPSNLLWVYPIKTIVVAATLWYFRKSYEELRSPMICRASGSLAADGKQSTAGGPPALQSWLFAIVVGLVAIVIWIAIDRFYPKLSSAAPFDATGQWVFITFRVAGAVVVVPLMEELFWRAFLIRWLVNEDFKKVPVGTFTWASFGITAALFGAEHNEWLAGLICGALYNWLYYRRKDVFSCVVAHAVSNAALAAWVLARGDWKFW
jgi:CAAX prenyl protease-like protein